MTPLWHALEYVASGCRPVRAYHCPRLRMRRRLVRARNRVVAAVPAGALVAVGVMIGRWW